MSFKLKSPRILILIRFGVSLSVTFSTVTGYIVSAGKADAKLIYVALGVFFLAAGASALNQFQERKTDALMERTKNRPLPSGEISPLTGLVISEILCLLGLVILLYKTGPLPALLGLFNLLWYNGLYTYLKKKTAFAVVPGALTGVVPLLIGWTAGNGKLLSPIIIFISFFIFMWQIPHFWLLLIRYKKDYENAKLGTLFNLFSGSQINRILFTWIIATSLGSLLFPTFGIITMPVQIMLVFSLNILLVITFYLLLFKNRNKINFKFGFVSLNLFQVLIMLILIIEKIAY